MDVFCGRHVDEDEETGVPVLSLLVALLLGVVNAFSLRSRSVSVVPVVVGAFEVEATLLFLGAKIIGGFGVWFR